MLSSKWDIYIKLLFPSPIKAQRTSQKKQQKKLLEAGDWGRVLCGMLSLGNDMAMSLSLSFSALWWILHLFVDLCPLQKAASLTKVESSTGLISVGYISFVCVRGSMHVDVETKCLP